MMTGVQCVENCEGVGLNALHNMVASRVQGQGFRFFETRLHQIEVESGD
jgi:hypothetical protein